MRDLLWVPLVILAGVVVAILVSVAVADPKDCWKGDCKIVCDGETCRQECKEFCRE